MHVNVSVDFYIHIFTDFYIHIFIYIYLHIGRDSKSASNTKCKYIFTYICEYAFLLIDQSSLEKVRRSPEYVRTEYLRTFVCMKYVCTECV